MAAIPKYFNATTTACRACNFGVATSPHKKRQYINALLTAYLIEFEQDLKKQKEVV